MRWPKSVAHWLRRHACGSHESRFTRDTALLSLGTVAAQMVGIAAMPVLTRLYAPSDFGVLAIFTAVSGITATVVTLRYETTILLPKDTGEARHLATLSAVLALVIGALLLVLSISWLTLFPLPSVVSGLGWWLPGALATGACLGCIAVALTFMSRERRYGRISVLRVGQSTVAVSAALLLGFAHRTDGLLIAQLLAVLVVSSLVVPKLLQQPWRVGAKTLFDAAKRHKAAPTFLLLSSVLDVVSLQLPVLIISAKYGVDSAGQFSMAWKVLGLPAAILGSAIGQVFYQRAAADLHDDVRLVARKFVKISAWLGALTLVPATLVTWWGRQGFVFVLGEPWNIAGAMAEILIISVALYFVFSPTSSILIVLGRQRVLVFFGIGQLAYRALASLHASTAFDYIRTVVLFEVMNVALFIAVVVYFLRAAIRSQQQREQPDVSARGSFPVRSGSATRARPGE